MNEKFDQFARLYGSNPTRGISVELLLTNLLAARERSVCPQLVGLSAVIGDLNAFDEWLGCGKLLRTDRPVPLVEGDRPRRVVRVRRRRGPRPIRRVDPAARDRPA